MAAMAKCVFNFSLHCLELTVRFFDLTQSDNSMNELHLRLFIWVWCRRRRPLDLLSTNGFGTGRVSWYAAIFV